MEHATPRQTKKFKKLDLGFAQAKVSLPRQSSTPRRGLLRLGVGVSSINING